MHYFSTKLYTDDIEAAIRFYSEILGLPPTRRYDKAILLGQHLLITESGENGIYFESWNFQAVRNSLEEAGYPLSFRTTSAGQQILRLSDPMGNQIEIGEAMEAVIRRLLDE